MRRNTDARLQKSLPAAPVGFEIGNERWLVLSAGVEIEPRTGLDHERGDTGGFKRQKETVEEVMGPHFFQEAEVMRVGRERDALVAQLGDDRDGVFEPVVREPALPFGSRLRRWSGNRFDHLNLGHLLPQLVLERRDDRHDRRRAAGARAGQPDLGDPVRHVQYLNAGAVERQRRGDLGPQRVFDTIS
jgi:hypothetical protein